MSAFVPVSRKGSWHRRRGVTAIEYAILCFLIAVAIIAALFATGTNLSKVFGGIGNTLAAVTGSGSGGNGSGSNGNYPGETFGPNTTVAGGTQTWPGMPPIPAKGVTCSNAPSTSSGYTQSQFLNASPTQVHALMYNNNGSGDDFGVTRTCFINGTNPQVPFSTSYFDYTWTNAPYGPAGTYILLQYNQLHLTGLTYDSSTSSHIGNYDETKYPLNSTISANENYAKNYYAAYNSTLGIPQSQWWPSTLTQSQVNTAEAAISPIAQSAAAITPAMAVLIGYSDNPITGQMPYQGMFALGYWNGAPSPPPPDYSAPPY